MRTRSVAVAGLLLLFGQPARSEQKQLWLYTSIYKEFAQPLIASYDRLHPDTQVQLFQGGSEKIQAKVEAELSVHRPQADLLLTSDPFWSQDLEKRGLLLTRPGHPATEINYYSVMVLIAHARVPAANRPASFADLAKPEFDNLVQMGSPLESGTTFSAVAMLSRKYGWDYFKKLAANHVASSGGNATVIQKVESGEKKFGLVLLENALAARKRGSPVEIIHPSDLSIPIPSVQVILKDTRNPEAAASLADFVLGAEGQKLLRNGYMYSVRKDVPPPEGAPPFEVIQKNATPWTPELIREVSAQSREIKKKFASLLLE